MDICYLDTVMGKFFIISSQIWQDIEIEGDYPKDANNIAFSCGHFDVSLQAYAALIESFAPSSKSFVFSFGFLESQKMHVHAESQSEADSDDGLPSLQAALSAATMWLHVSVSASLSAFDV